MTCDSTTPVQFESVIITIAPANTKERPLLGRACVAFVLLAVMVHFLR